MAIKTTLAEKFASRKESNGLHNTRFSHKIYDEPSYKPFSSNRSKLENPESRYEPLAKKGSYNGESLRSKYEQSRKVSFGDRVPSIKNFSSPIKRIRISPRRSRPATIYKFSRDRLGSPGTSKVVKDGSGLFKKAERTKSVGLLDRFKNFLSSIHLNGSDDSEILALRNSANIIRPRTPSKPREPREPWEPQEKRALPEEHDDVDFAIREAERKREISKLSQERETLERQLAAEKEEKRALKEEYDRKLYLLRGDFESQVHSLDEKIEQLMQDSQARSVELEKEHLDTIQQVVLQQNETFLVHQKQSESKIEELNRRMAQREEDLKSREQQLKAMMNQITNGSKVSASADRASDHQQPLTRPTFDKYLTEMEGLHADKVAIDTSIQQHEADIIEFYETLQAVSQRRSGEGSLISESGLLEQVQKLLATLDANASAEPHPYFQKFKEYEEYFAGFSEGSEQYDKDTLQGIETSFQTVREHLRHKLLKCKVQKRQYDNVLAEKKLTISGVNHETARTVVEALTGRTKVLSRQQQTVELLEKLNELTKNLDKLMSR